MWSSSAGKVSLALRFAFSAELRHVMGITAAPRHITVSYGIFWCVHLHFYFLQDIMHWENWVRTRAESPVCSSEDFRSACAQTCLRHSLRFICERSNLNRIWSLFLVSVEQTPDRPFRVFPTVADSMQQWHCRDSMRMIEVASNHVSGGNSESCSEVKNFIRTSCFNSQARR